MRKIVGLICAIVLLTGCSDDDTSGDNITDTRFKLVFDYNGSGTIIGDHSNKVLKRFGLDANFLTILGYYKNEQSDDLFIATRQTAHSGYAIGKIVPLEILNSEIQNFSIQPVIQIPFNQNETLVSFQLISENQYFLLVSNSEGLVYKRYNSENIIETKNLSDDFNIYASSLNGIVYSKDLNQLILLRETFPDYHTRINKINLNNWALTIPDAIFNSNLFGSFSNNNEIFLIGRKEVNFKSNEYLYNSDGEIISQTDNTSIFLSGSAIGYDNIDQRFEYVHRSDMRSETGIINVQTGQLNKSFIIGEAGFHNSGLIFFNN